MMRQAIAERSVRLGVLTLVLAQTAIPHAAAANAPPPPLGATFVIASGVTTANSDTLRPGRPSIAFDGTRYLVISCRDLGSPAGLFGQFVSAQGQDGFPFQIAPTPCSPPADVAFDGSNYLVVFNLGGRMVGVRISPAGAVLDSPPFDIGAAPASTGPAIAFDGTNYLVVWSAFVASSHDPFGGHDIFGARVTPAGQVLDEPALEIFGAAGEQSLPSVAFDGVNYLVVWHTVRLEPVPHPDMDILGSRITTTGINLDPAGISISTAPSPQSSPHVVFAAGNYLVAWSDTRNDSSSIFATRVSPDGVLLDGPADTGGIAVNTFPQAGKGASRVGFDGTDYVVVWELGGFFGQIRGARISVEGTLLDGPAGGQGLLLAPNCGFACHPVYPSILSGGTGTSLVAWTNNTELGGSRKDVLGRFVGDRFAPETYLTFGPPEGSLTNQNSATFAFYGSDDVTDPTRLRFQCALDGGPFQPCSVPRNLTGLIDGAHAFAVRAIDNAGNTDTTPAIRHWTVDTMPPDTLLLAGPADGSMTNQTSATFDFTGSDEVTAAMGLRFECALDGGFFAPCTSPASLAGLADGVHTFAVRATDGAGNTDTTPTTRGWTVDTVPPSLWVSASPAVLWPPNHRLRTITVYVAASDPSGIAGVVLVSVTSNEPDDGVGDGRTTGDIQDAQPGTDDRTLLLRAERSDRGIGRIYTLTYEATDPAGNRTAFSTRVIVPLHLEDGPKYRYETLRIEYPGAQVTIPYARNDGGELAGSYIDESGVNKAFAYVGRHRTFVSIHPTGSVETVARDINNRGDVVGYYSDSTGPHGFLYRNGTLTPVDLAAAGTYLVGMNDAGDTVGTLYEVADDGSARGRSFLRRADGTLTFIEFAGASTIFATDVNDAGQVTGAFADFTGTVHGFIWREGQVVVLDVPGHIGLTQPNGINDRGEVVGVYLIPEGYRGFRYAAGRFTTIHYRRGIGSAASKIDDRGQILGEYYPAVGNPGYFVAIPEDDDADEDR